MIEIIIPNMTEAKRTMIAISPTTISSRKRKMSKATKKMPNMIRTTDQITALLKMVEIPVITQVEVTIPKTVITTPRMVITPTITRTAVIQMITEIKRKKSLLMILKTRVLQVLNSN